MSALVQVWTDGSCLNNGKVTAVSAMGAYYGQNDSRNYSSLLIMDKQTNNRAELVAILYAVVMDFKRHNLLIHTDSKYSINCITEYAYKWEKNGWLTAKGQPVESSQLIKFIRLLISERDNIGLSTELVYVRAHASSVENNAVDLLARRAASNTKEGGRILLLRKCGVPV